MIPMQLLWTQMVTALGADSLTFSPPLSLAVWIGLVKVPFAPGLGLVFTDATDKATFTGATPKAILTGVRVPVNDPLTARLTINLPGPIGGFTYVCTVDPTTPETIYGVCLTADSTTFAATRALASALLPAPVTITAAGDFVQFDDAALVFNPAMVS